MAPRFPAMSSHKQAAHGALSRCKPNHKKSRKADLFRTQNQRKRESKETEHFGPGMLPAYVAFAANACKTAPLSFMVSFFFSASLNSPSPSSLGCCKPVSLLPSPSINPTATMPVLDLIQQDGLQRSHSSTVQHKTGGWLAAASSILDARVHLLHQQGIHAQRSSWTLHHCRDSWPRGRHRFKLLAEFRGRLSSSMFQQIHSNARQVETSAKQ